MRVRNEEQFQNRKTELMEKCFECFAEIGLDDVGVRALAKHCNCNVAVFYNYFKDLDDLIVQSTEYCMSKVEDDFMAKAPTNIADLWRFIDEVPYWTSAKHGKKYRFMYQVYTQPKYLAYGKKFFDGVNKRYFDYAKLLEGNIGIPADKLTSLIFILVRACVHYAMFEDNYYLQAQIGVLKESLEFFIAKYNPTLQ